MTVITDKKINIIKQAAAFFAAALLVFSLTPKSSAQTSKQSAQNIIYSALSLKNGEISLEERPICAMLADSDTPVPNAQWYALAAFCSGNGEALSRYADRLSAEYDGSGVFTDRLKTALVMSAAQTGKQAVSSVLADAPAQRGVTALCYSLMLLDSRSYGNDLCSRDVLIKKILEKETPSGGFSVSGKSGDADVTAIALQALSGYVEYSDVSAVTQRCIDFLSSSQNPDGGFSSFGTENCESAAQVICALCAMGIDPQADTRFIKNGSSPVDALLRFITPDGGFSHIKDGATDDTATVQSALALSALLRYGSSGSGSIFRFVSAAAERDYNRSDVTSVSESQADKEAQNTPDGEPAGVTQNGSVPSPAENTASAPEADAGITESPLFVGESAARKSESAAEDDLKNNKSTGSTKKLMVIIGAAGIVLSVAILIFVAVGISKSLSVTENAFTKD